MLQPSFFILVALCAGSILLSAFCLLKLRQLQSTNNELKQQLANLQRLNQQNQLAVEEVRNGSIGMGKAIQASKQEFIQQVQTLIDKQNELALQDPESRLYSRAAKMVAKGATVEEIMHECEIPRAEAELVLAMRGRG